MTTDDGLFRRALDQRDQMRVEVVRPDEITDRLGPAGAMRFMMQYDPGHGDYTKERQQIFADLELEDLIAAIKQQETGSSDDP